jgi:hypothetical protein
MKTILLLIGLFAVFSCAPNPYRPFRNDLGYSEFKETEQKYEVMFHGSKREDVLGAKKLALVRAAEIAKREAYPYFRVDTMKAVEKVVHKSYVTSDPYCDYSYGGWYPGHYGFGYGGGYGYGGYYGGNCPNTVVRYTETHPEVKLEITLQTLPCDGCVSVDEQLQQAADAGIISKDRG